MKIFIDCGTLVSLTSRNDNTSLENFLSRFADQPYISLWVSAESLPRVYDQACKTSNHEQALAYLRQLKAHCSIIPLRNATLVQALNNPTAANFEEAIEAASANTLNMDIILTERPACFAGLKARAISPRDFKPELENGRATQTGKVPFLDLTAQHPLIYNEIDDRLTDCIETNGFILGKHVTDFEAQFAALHESRFCLGVSTGTDALHVALVVLGIGPGDGVIVPVNTFIASAEAVSLCGAQPVFVDCDEYYNLDTAQLRHILQTKNGKNGVQIKAIMPVHLYGQPANMDEVCAIAKEFGLKIVEDCCQAHLAAWQGKKVGNFGEFGAFSFYPGKNLGAYGEAGAITTNNEEHFKKADMYRQHGATVRYHHNIIGHNYRMEGFQGAVLATKARHLADWTRKRQANAALYNELLAGVPEISRPRESPGATSCAYHLYVIQTEERDALQAFLNENKIENGLHYPIPLHLQEAYKYLGHQPGEFPEAEKGAKRILSLPMYPELRRGQIERVVSTINRFFGR